jgi:hypothetical protein
MDHDLFSIEVDVGIWSSCEVPLDGSGRRDDPEEGERRINEY